MDELGQTVLLARTAKRMSQDQVGRAIGKSHGWVSNLETGRQKEFRVEDLNLVAKLLDLDAKRLVDLAGLSPTAPPRRVGLSPAELEEIVRRGAVLAVDEVLERLGLGASEAVVKRAQQAAKAARSTPRPVVRSER